MKASELILFFVAVVLTAFFLHRDALSHEVRCFPRIEFEERLKQQGEQVVGAGVTVNSDGLFRLYVAAHGDWTVAVVPAEFEARLECPLTYGTDFIEVRIEHGRGG